MALSKNELEELLRLVGLTEEDEIDCDECLARVAELAEREPADKSIPERLKAVQHHLAVCAECREEYEALQEALKEMDL